MAENCSAIRPNKLALEAWIKKLKALHSMVHDMAGVCGSLVQHLDLFFNKFKSGDSQTNPESYAVFALVTLRIWK